MLEERQIKRRRIRKKLTEQERIKEKKIAQQRRRIARFKMQLQYAS